MKIFLSVLILIFSFQSWTKADDIRDFEIEGISIGDSALDYFSESEIIKQKQDYFNDKTYTDSEIFSKNNSIYHSLHVIYKTNDKNYIIEGLEGTVLYTNNVNKCYKRLDEIDEEISDLFKKTKREKKPKRKHPADKTGKSTTTDIIYFFKNGDVIMLSCYDWSKEKGYADHLRISLSTSEFDNWLYTTAFK